MTTDTRRFAGYGVLVTGAARGIGAATAAVVRRGGARVLAADVAPDEAERTAAVLRERGFGAGAFGCDVTDRTSVEGAAAHAVHTFGSLDVLVDNAAHRTADAPRFEDEPDDEWAVDLDVTLTGAYRCCRADSGRGGIVNVGSVSGLQDLGDHAHSAAEAGLVSLTRTVRTRARAGRGVALEAARRLHPLGRGGEPGDIAAAVALLASRDAAWITGTNLAVDGGTTAVNSGFRQVLGETPPR